MKNLLLYILILGGVILATLSGCQKEEVAPSQEEFKPISRLESETMLKQWNTQRKSKLKSAATITISEKQWQKAKVYMNPTEQISIISIPLRNKITLCFGKYEEGSRICFCETRPDNLYLAKTNGKVDAKSYTGYLIFYNDKGKGIVAYRYVQGQFEGKYEVVQKPSSLKANFDIYGGLIEGGVCISQGKAMRDWMCCSIDEWCKNLCLPNLLNEDYGGGIYADITPPTNPKPVVDTTDASFKDTKADCIFEKLVGTTSTNMYDPNSVVGKLLKDYWGTTHNLTFTIVDKSKLEYANSNAECVTNNINNNVIIRLNREYVENCTNVELARTLIHESIHAEIFARIQGMVDGASSDLEFDLLFEKYKDYCQQRDHSIMSEYNYVDLIAKGIEAYHDSYMGDFDANVIKYCGSDFDNKQFYNMTAWGGLKNTLEFNSKNKDATWNERYIKYSTAGSIYDVKDCK